MGHVIDGIAEYMKGREEATIEELQNFIERRSGTHPTYSAIIASVVQLNKFGENLKTIDGHVRRTE